MPTHELMLHVQVTRADELDMSSLPAFHSKAKADAAERAKSVQERLADASSFLAEIDEELARINPRDFR